VESSRRSVESRRSCRFVCALVVMKLGPSRVWPLHAHLRCHGPNDSRNESTWNWTDDRGPSHYGEEHMASGLGEAFVSDALSALAGRWVVLVGDSSIRMVYHFLIQFLSGEWESWPGSVGSHYQAGSCFDVPKEAHEGGCSWDSPSCPCLEDAFVDRTRLTMVWTKYGHSADLLPLQRLANSSVGTPSLVLLSVSSWWGLKDAWKCLGWNGSYAQQYERALRGVVDMTTSAFIYRRRVRVNGTDVPSTYGRAAWDVPQLFVFMAAPNCGNTMPPNTQKRIQECANIARSVLAELPDVWHWFDRETLTRSTCMPEEVPDCSQGYPHPTGHVLNRYLHVLFQGVAPRLHEMQARAAEQRNTTH